jgi:hypothetical protein
VAAAEAADFDHRTIGILLASGSVPAPAIRGVKALRALVAAQDPEDPLGEAGVPKAAAGLEQKRASGTRAPTTWLYVEGVDLTGARRVLVP